MLQRLSIFGTAIGDAWCQTMHSTPMWPVGGEYKCRQCHRSFRVPWEQKPISAVEEKAKAPVGAESSATQIA